LEIFFISFKTKNRLIDSSNSLSYSNHKDWKPIETIKDCIGMSYEHFKKTVIIPQGKFQDFIQLSQTERTTMLKDLFSLEKYDLFDKVKNLEHSNQDSMSVLQGKVSNYEDASQDEIDKKMETLVTLSEDMENQKSSLDTFSLYIKENEKLKELFSELEENQKELEDLSKHEKNIQTLEATIKQYELCKSNFEKILYARKENLNNIENTQKNIHSKNKELLRLKPEQEKEQIEFQEVEKNYNNRSNFQNRITELKKLQELKSLESELLVLKENQGIILSNKKATLAKIQNKENEKKSLEEMIQEKKNSTKDHSMYFEIKQWKTERDSILSQKISLDKKVLQFLEERKLLIEKFNSLIANIQKQLSTQEATVIGSYIYSDIEVPLNRDEKNSTLPALENELEKILSEKTKQITIIEKTFREESWKAKLKEFSESLSDGKPCHLCGSKEHPDKYSHADTDSKLLELTSAKENLEADLDFLRKKLQEVNRLGDQFYSTMKELHSNNQELTSTLDKLETHTTAYIWTYPQDKLELLDKEIKKINQLLKDIEKEEKSKTPLETLIQTLRKSLEELSTKENEGIEKLATYRTKIEEIQNNFLQTISLEDSKKIPTEKIDREIKQLTSWIENLETIYLEKRALVEKLTKNIHITNGELNSCNATLVVLETAKKEIELEIETQIKKLGYTNVKEIELVLSNAMNIEAERQKISVYKNKVAIVKNRIDLLEVRTKGKDFTVEKFQAMVEEYNKQVEVLEQVKKQKIELETSISQMKENLTTKVALLNLIKQLEEREKGIKELKNLFNSQGFVNYISGIFLSDICSLANHRFFELTQKRLQIELGENNQLMVRDFLNDGHIRTIKTLSGGQTFQASLCLALALSDRIRANLQNAENFFFMDEGFGSLDKDSLDIVFSTLQSLQEENRIVGIISHVEDMKMEIGKYIKVDNTRERGSIISKSWDI